MTEDDRRHMARALALAERGLFTTTPNPRVGCVIVRDGRVLGEGFHERAGLAHAFGLRGCPRSCAQCARLVRIDPITRSQRR